jgi:hypothetical protein
MHNELPPLHYAIIEHFTDGMEDCAQGVIKALEKDYAGYKLLNAKAVSEMLATAKENGILEEASYCVNSKGDLIPTYRMDEFGREMVRRYLG